VSDIFDIKNFCKEYLTIVKGCILLLLIGRSLDGFHDEVFVLW